MFNRVKRGYKKIKMDEIKKVENIINLIPSVKNMKGIPNQFEIYGKDYTLFQSYNSPIALIQNGKTYIFKNWNYSTTTGKYRNQFLNETKKETLAKLKSGVYVAVDFDINQY